MKILPNFYFFSMLVWFHSFLSILDYFGPVQQNKMTSFQWLSERAFALILHVYLHLELVVEKFIFNKISVYTKVFFLLVR